VSAPPATAWKILTGAQWEDFQATGRFEGSPDDRRDGFIHLSAADQVEGTLARHFAGQAGLVFAEIDLATLGDGLKWEQSRGGALFPHHYGVLTIDSVRTARILQAQQGASR
jgi:ornithine lipid ester-linked acyl 2-hydroxylase